MFVTCQLSETRLQIYFPRLDWSKAIAEHAYSARDYALLTSSVTLLSKKHGQLKGAIQALVELSMGWLEEIKKEAGIEKWLALIETLRGVTEGKVSSSRLSCLERLIICRSFWKTPRARVTLLLSHYHEFLSTIPNTHFSPHPKESLQTASDLLSDLQVETYSSMERREKTEFILEQMRLLIGVARLKDEEIGKEGKDFIRRGRS
jgi:26S proteasome regulatory subunit N5